jgi:hypothetical protein
MKFIAALFFLCATASVANAQITITEADYIGSVANAFSTNTSYSDTTLVGLDAIIAQSGPNQIWDFTNLNFSQDVNHDPKVLSADIIPFNTSAAPLANDPDFSSANTIVKIAYGDSLLSRYYEYDILDQNEYSTCGEVSADSTNSGTKLVSFVPAELRYKFPLTYQTTWTAVPSREFGVYFDTTGGQAEYVENDGLIDGFGKLILPNGGGTHDALRLRENRISMSVGKDGTRDTTHYYAYNWLTKDNVDAFINAGPQLSSLAQAAGYSVTKTNGVQMSSEPANTSLHLSENPIRTSSTLDYTLPKTGVAVIMVMNALGQTVARLSNEAAKEGRNSVTIGAANLPNGTYFVRVMSGKFSATQKFVVAK